MKLRIKDYKYLKFTKLIRGLENIPQVSEENNFAVEPGKSFASFNI